MGRLGKGLFLIKQVVDDLSHELPNLKTFATLSPIPGFRNWLDSRLEAGADLLSHEQQGQLAALAGDSGDTPPLQALLDRPQWYQDDDIVGVLQLLLQHLVAGYLLYQRRESTDTALDSVAHFHLSNGAQVERINWLADSSDRGLAQSAGMMVNYLYALDQIEDNHEAYVSGGEIPASSAVRYPSSTMPQPLDPNDLVTKLEWLKTFSIDYATGVTAIAAVCALLLALITLL